MWWRWRDLNPRPQTFSLKLYVHSLILDSRVMLPDRQGHHASACSVFSSLISRHGSGHDPVHRPSMAYTGNRLSKGLGGFRQSAAVVVGSYQLQRD